MAIHQHFLSLALLASFLATAPAMASDNPFASADSGKSFQLAANEEKCGGKPAASTAAKPKAKSGKKSKKETKADAMPAGKCGAGKCGAQLMGEGKCGK